MRIGIVQTSPRFADKPLNREQIESLVGTQSADLWVMPELALTGYEFHDRAEVSELAEEIPNGETCQWLTEFCLDHECHAVIGLAERAGARVYNSAVLVSRDGLIGHYRKIHLFHFEKERFDPGNLPYKVYDVGSARVGLMICFDWRFPEASRTLALLGAQILAHPSNLVMPYCQRAMVTRALENRVFCVTTNRIGTENRNNISVTFTGASQIVNPHGEIIVHGPTDQATTLVVDINPSEADDKSVNAHNDVLSDRRTEFYLEK